MQKVFEEYGGVIITVIAIVALIAIVSLMLADGGIMSNAFDNLVTSFATKTETLVNNITVTPVS